MSRGRRTQTWWQVECMDCDFWTEGKNGLGNAAQHHQSTGHEVWADAFYSVVYDAEEEDDGEA